MATALDVLAERARETGFDVDARAARETIESLILTNSPIRNASEVAWGLWAAIALDIELGGDVADQVCVVEDDFVALLALHADALGLFSEKALDRSVWESSAAETDALSGPHWLLAYEGVVRSWLDVSRKNIRNDSFFKVLSARRVRFYDTDPSRSPFTGPAGPLPGGLVPEDYA
jgi:hypothetical protein